MGRRNLDNMRAIDTAWNKRQWADYAALFDDELVAWMTGDDRSHGKADHLLRAQQFCATCPDARVASGYLELFLSLDGQITCSVALLSGTRGLRCFNVPFSVICRWHDGRVVEQREFFDETLFKKQLETHAGPEGDPS